MQTHVSKLALLSVWFLAAATQLHFLEKMVTDVLEALSLVWLNDKKILSVVNLCTPLPLYGLSYATTQVAANGNFTAPLPEA